MTSTATTATTGKSCRSLARGTLVLAVSAIILLLISALVAYSFCFSCKEAAPSATDNAQQQARLASRLRHDVEQLCAHPRYGDEKNRSHAADYITQRLTAAGWQVHQNHFDVPHDPESEPESSKRHLWRTSRNIIATSPDTATSNAQDAHPRKRYIIGAHYDACKTDEGNPGADDNASACAALLSLADMLAPGKGLPKGKGVPALELVFYDCEEPPWFGTTWMGSAHHARHCTPENTLGMICLEMLGYYSEAPCAHPELLPGHHLLLPERGNFISIVGDLTARSLARRAQQHLMRGMPALRVNLPFAEETELFFSDHRNYASRNIPSIMVTDTALLRNPHYHEATDTPDTLNYPRLARVTRNLASFIRDLLRE